MGCVARLFFTAEQQADAPQASQTHQGENDAGKDGQLTAAEERHQVEAEWPVLPQFRAPMMTRINAILSRIMVRPPF